MKIERHHWLNTYLGILDSVFFLTENEEFHTIKILSDLLAALNIPDRSTPAIIPSSVALEAKSSFYTINLDGSRKSERDRLPRVVYDGDTIVSQEAWRDMFVNMLVTAYPDLSPEERVLISKIFSDLLTALGVPERMAAYFPDDVVKSWLSSPEGQNQ